MNSDHPEDGRKYHIGDKVEFTDDEGNKVPGIVHGVSYKQGHYEHVDFDREDNFDENSPKVPGTGRMEIIPGTEDQRHSFEYIIVPEHEHKEYQRIEKSNLAKAKRNEANIEKFKGSVHKDDPYHPENFRKMPPSEPHEELPVLTQHIRVYEED